MPIPRKILLNPGPCTTSDAVKHALLMPDLCPREKEFATLLGAVRAKLTAVADAVPTHSAVLIPGSGTAAIEACLGSLVGPSDHLLVIENGAYGERAARIAAVLGLSHRVHRLPWGEPLELQALTAALDQAPAPTFCFLVHHETSTGMLNPLEAVVEACRARGIITLVDAMSSFGGVPLSLATTPADFVISSANKCLQGLPGLSFVLGRTTLLKASGALPRRSVYLNLHDNWRSQDGAGQFLFTPPVQVLNALNTALDELQAESLPARHRRYAACYRTLIAGMKALGFRPLVAERWHSQVLTAFLEPDDPAWSFADMHDHLYAQGITVYPGTIPGRRCFRIANLGALQPCDIELFLAHLATYLQGRGITLPRSP